MYQKNNPAFPVERSNNDGLSKREHLAFQIMAGLAANPALIGESVVVKAKTAVEMTDALLGQLP